MFQMINITVMPFLLGAMVSIKNDTERWSWDADPEYTFQINKTTAVLMDISVFENVTAMVTCRLNSSFMENTLFCHANKVILSKLTQEAYDNMRDGKTDDANFIPRIAIYKMPDRVFELEFNIQGVQGVKVQGEELDSHSYDIVPDIIDQFNMGIDLSNERNSMKNYENETSGAHVISSFTQINEETMRASKCNTSLIITYIPSNHSHKDGEHDYRITRLRQDSKTKLELDFLLKLLPISYTNPADKTFLIEKRRKACIGGPRNIKFLNEEWKINNITQYYNVMELRRTKPKFASRTYLEGHVLHPLKDSAHYFWEDVRLDLHNIRFLKKDSEEYEDYDYNEERRKNV